MPTRVWIACSRREAAGWLIRTERAAALTLRCFETAASRRKSVRSANGPVMTRRYHPPPRNAEPVGGRADPHRSRALTLLHMQPPTVEETRQHTTGAGAPLIDVDHVKKTYSSGTVALADAAFKHEPGQFVGLVGPSACVKATLLRAIAVLA